MSENGSENGATRKELAVETRAIDDLRPDANNLKTHPNSQIDSLVASIRRFGFNDPIGIDEDNNIIEGHGRYEAAKRLGMDSVPVIVLSGLSERERRAYAIAHNQTTMNTGMDREAVQSEFADLGVGPGDYLSIGYTEDDVLFLSEQFDFDEQGAARTDHNGHEVSNPNAFLPTVHRSTIHFDNEAQADRFQTFIMALRERYPDGVTMADRLTSFMDEYGDGSV